MSIADVKARIESVKNDIESIESKIIDVRENIESKQNEISSFEIDEDDYRDEFDESFNETISIMGVSFETADILKNVDPTTYEVELTNYVSSIDFNDVPAYTQLTDELEALEDTLADFESELEDLDDELTELEEELEELEAEEGDI